jgi:hypothetical protein
MALFWRPTGRLQIATPSVRFLDLYRNRTFPLAVLARYDFENLPTTNDSTGRPLPGTDQSLGAAIRMKQGRNDIAANRRDRFTPDQPVIRIRWTGREDPLIIRDQNPLGDNGRRVWAVDQKAASRLR